MAVQLREPAPELRIRISCGAEEAEPATAVKERPLWERRMRGEGATMVMTMGVTTGSEGGAVRVSVAL